MQIRLPYPPSINSYYVQRRRLKCGRCGGLVKVPPSYLSKGAREFRSQVGFILDDQVSLGASELAVRVDLHAPRDAGDLDNRIKSLLDACEHAQLFDNDRQVADLRIVRSYNILGGAADVRIWEL